MTTGLWRLDILAGACACSLGDAGLPKYYAHSNCSHRLCCHKGKDSTVYFFSGRRITSGEPEKQKPWGRIWLKVIYRFIQFSSPCTPHEGDKTDSQLADTTSRRGTIWIYSFDFMLCFWASIFFCQHISCVCACVLASLKQCLWTQEGSDHMQQLWGLRNNRELAHKYLQNCQSLGCRAASKTVLIKIWGSCLANLVW